MKKNKSKEDFYLEYSDGTPFTVPEIDETDWAAIIRLWEEAKNEIRANFAQMDIQTSGLHWDDAGPKIDAGRKLNEKQFREEFAAMRHFLEGKNKILPANAEQFLIWFIRVKNGRKPISEILSQWPNIIPADFKEFHRYKKYLYKHGGEVGDIIPIPDSNNSLEDTVLPQLNEVVKNTDTDFPPLMEVIKDAAAFLPKLWEALAGMPMPLVKKSGKYNWDGVNVSVLMALAQALKTADKVLGDYSTEQVYRILCRHFNTPEAKRPRIKARTETGFTNVYFDYLSDLNDTLQGL